MKKNTLSVIIPTRDRPFSLGLVLKALSKQTRPVDEIIVVDNSNYSFLDKYDKVVVKYQSLPIRFFHLELSSASKSRNYGISKSKGEILAFLDDDSIPAKDWAEEISKSSLVGNFCFRGLVRSASKKKSIISDFYRFLKKTQLVELRRRWRTYGKWRNFQLVDYIQAGNFFIKRNVIKEMRPVFDERLFPFLAEEMDFSQRLRKAGFQILYAKNVKVKHLFHRLSFLNFIIKSPFWYGRAAAIFRRRNKDYHRLISHFRQELKNCKKSKRKRRTGDFFNILRKMFAKKNPFYKINFLAIFIIYFSLYRLGFLYGKGECFWREKIFKENI